MKALAASLLLSTILSWSCAASAQALKANLAPDKVRIDGMAQEWFGQQHELDVVVRGTKPTADDLAAKVLIAYDDKGIYVAAQVTDDKLVASGDHLELLIGIPGGKTKSLLLFPGVAGKSRAVVKSGNSRVSGAKIVEAPTDEGYTLEASIPWRAIPESKTIRVGYRGALFLHDADKSRSIETIIGTTESRSYAQLPSLSTEAELALGAGLLREKNLVAPPVHNVMANVFGDGMQERVLVYGRYLAVLGPGYREGLEYFYSDLGSNAGRGELPQFELRDLTGDNRDEIVMRKRVRGPQGTLEILEILSYHSGNDTPVSIFSHEVALELDVGRIDNEVRIDARGARTKITVRIGKTRGLDAGTRIRAVSNTGAKPILTPWGSVSERVFLLDNGIFEISAEKENDTSSLPPPSVAPAPNPRPSAHRPPPRRPSPRRPSPRRVVTHRRDNTPDLEQVYRHYKKQKGVTGRARFDLSGNFAADRRKERVVVHGRDLVVFGPGFRGGGGYSVASLAVFEKDRDVKSVEAKDVTGDGRQEIVVHGELRSPLPSDIGEGTMRRKVVMVYKIKGTLFERIFAAEISRKIDGKSITASVAFKRGEIVLKPGRASGYTERTYPWAQKTTPSDSFEPLLLPWGGVDRVRLRYDGSTFVRR